jgi:hypothetical protein
MVGVVHPGVVAVVGMPPAFDFLDVLVEAVVGGEDVCRLAMHVASRAELALHSLETPAMAPAPELVLVHGGR